MAFVAAVLCAAATRAATFNGYIGLVTLQPAKSVEGQAGRLYFSVYSQPSSGGMLVTNAYVCSKGATSTACDLSATVYGPKYLLTEAQLLALYNSLVHAADKGLRVSVTQPTVNGHFQGITILAPD